MWSKAAILLGFCDRVETVYRDFAQDFLHRAGWHQLGCLYPVVRFSVGVSYLFSIFVSSVYFCLGMSGSLNRSFKAFAMMFAISSISEFNFQLGIPSG